MLSMCRYCRYFLGHCYLVMIVNVLVRNLYKRPAVEEDQDVVSLVGQPA